MPDFEVPPLSSPAESNSLPRARVFRRTLIGVGVTLVVAALLTAALQWLSDHARRTQLLLADLDASVHELSAVEWQVAATHGGDPEVEGRLGEAMTSLELDVLQLSGRDVGPGKTVELHAPSQRYLHAVVKELELFRAGRADEARRFDEREVDPAFTDLTRRIAGYRLQCDGYARMAWAVGLWGTLAAALGAIAVIGVLMWLDSRASLARWRAVRERKLASERNRNLAEANARLEAANAGLVEAARVKSEFLANMSHELRTPLNAVIGFLDLVLDGLTDSPEETNEYLGTARSSALHLLALINDLLDLARIEAGGLELQLVDADVHALVNAAASPLRVLAAEKGLTLTVDAPAAGACRVRADERRARQVLINLVGNAIKFTERGSVQVRAMAAPGGVVQFAVTDTGIGIPPERQAEVFGRFVQVDGSSTRRHGGTGLGLAIARELVERMGGTIGLTSEGEGRGTTIAFTLPAAGVAGEADEERERLAA